MGLIAGVGVAGALLFEWLGLPVPWMLGPLFAVLLIQFFIKGELVWPVHFRNVGLIVIGVSIGGMFQFNLFAGMTWLVVFMLVMNIVLTIATVFIAFGVKKLGHMSLKTALSCTVPGGLAQIVTFAEEEEDVDLAIVTYFHVVRVISIVMLVPFILSGHSIQPDEDAFNASSPGLLMLLLLAAGGAVWIGRKIQIPVPYFLSPVLLMVVLKLFSIDTPEVPSLFLHVAQLFIGAYIGLLLKPDMIKLGNRVLLLGMGSALLLLVITFVQGLLVVHFLNYSLSTSFLSTAAGGLDQMSLLANAIGADVSIVTVFQVFRLLFVFLVVLPLLKVACAYLDRRVLKVSEDISP